MKITTLLYVYEYIWSFVSWPVFLMCPNSTYNSIPSYKSGEGRQWFHNQVLPVSTGYNTDCMKKDMALTNPSHY